MTGEHAWKFHVCLAGTAVAAVAILVSLLIATHDVRTVTKVVQATPGTPQGTVTSAQLTAAFAAGGQLDGLSCLYWSTSKDLTLVCKPATS